MYVSHIFRHVSHVSHLFICSLACTSTSASPSASTIVPVQESPRRSKLGKERLEKVRKRKSEQGIRRYQEVLGDIRSRLPVAPSDRKSRGSPQ